MVQALPATAEPINWNGTNANTQTTSPRTSIWDPPIPAVTETGEMFLFGHDDWGNVLYRARRLSTSPVARLRGDDQRRRGGLLQGRDNDQNGVGDNGDCGG